MNWVTSRYFVFFQLYLLNFQTLAQLDSDSERKLSSRSSTFDVIKSIKSKAQEIAELLQDPDDQTTVQRSEWFDGPPRLKCEPPPGVDATADMFMDAHLVDCMRNQPYDTSQLPLKSFGVRERLNLRYLFAINHLVDVDKDGKISVVITLKLVWYLYSAFEQVDDRK